MGVYLCWRTLQFSIMYKKTSDFLSNNLVYFPFQYIGCYDSLYTIGRDPTGYALSAVMGL